MQIVRRPAPESERRTKVVGPAPEGNSMSFNLATILNMATAEHGDKPFLRVGDSALTYAEIDDLSGRVAASLERLGLQTGDKVALHLPNTPEFVIAYFGVLKAGMTVVPLNPLLTAPEIVYHLSDSNARMILTIDEFAKAAIEGAEQAGNVLTYVVSTSGGRERQGASPFDDLLAINSTGDVCATSADDTAVLLYTSGTTGRPKGAELTHFQLYMNCTTAGDLFGVQSDDVLLGVLPLFHVFGLSSVLNLTVRYGATLVLIARFDAGEVISTIESQRCTVFAGVPTMYVALLQQDTAERDMSSLRAAISGGASIPGEVLRGFEEQFNGVAVLEGYGLSETASTATFNVSVDQRKVMSIGRPIWGVEVRVRDQDGHEMGSGPHQVGEIVIRGHNVMKGYYQRPDATAQAIRDGWFHTGDLGYRDDDGYFFIVDRLKDLIIRGGYNVYPREVEEVLYQHPAVVEAAVVGRPDDRLGEVVVAFVVLRPDLPASHDELVEHCKSRLAAYKYPRNIHFRAALPKGPSGKILKRELRT
jgi:long-chain acyl-CoA synthetase